MDLPSEILLIIFAPLERTDLKSSKLVSKTWRECASIILFDQIYVSSAKEDLEIFEAVAQDPLLSSCVRHLKYDATEFFKPLTKRQYIAELWKQRAVVSPDAYPSHWYTDDLAVNDWVNNGVLGHHISDREISGKFRHNQLIEKGYQTYKEHATYQQAALKSGRFLQRLAQGLRKFKDLREVTLESIWKYDPKADELRGSGERCTGSYLARHWNRFYCKPQGWRWGDACRFRGGDLDSWKISPDGTQSYKVITTALAQAGCHIVSFTVANDTFDLWPGLPPILFDLSGQTARQREKLSCVGVTAFANLEKFELLRLASHAESGKEGARTPEIFDNIDGLPLILESMNRLKHLELNLSADLSRPPSFYKEVQALPKNKVWHNLESLTLTNLSTTASSLLHLVLYQTPNILHVQIGSICLRVGSWEAFFEALSRSKHLYSIKLRRGNLFHHNGQVFWILRCSTFYKDLEEYVILGGRHPCLFDHLPDSVADEWLQEFDSTVRERIVQSAMRKTESTI